MTPRLVVEQMFATEHTAELGEVGSDDRQQGRPVGPAAVRNGARYGLSVSISRRSSGHSRAASRTSSALLNVTMPEKLRNAPRSRARRASSAPPVKQWNTTRVGNAHGGEHVERVVPRLAGVDHQRQGVLVGEGDLGGERLTLRVAWRVVVVVVEPALPDRQGVAVDRGRRSCRRRGEPRADAARRWPRPRRSVAAIRCAPIDVSRSHPTTIIVVTPAARASSIVVAGVVRIDVAVAVDPAVASRLDPREQRLALGDREPTGVAAPQRVARDALVGDRTGQAEALPDPLAVAGIAGDTSTVTMRSASMASPRTASTSGPGSAFHGSLASR